jgi:formate hydrogenlyase subunit 3/multisubunit Na+/H+ antiporter MnhD subunit
LPNNPVAIGAYLLLLSAALAKAGAFPFHTWIPSVAQAAPATFMAYLPAALDKLIGIYFIYRLTLELFIVTPNSFVSWFLLTLGSLTLIGAVMLALVQHNLKKLLAYHAVSQVGYMIIGIGTGIPLGIAGGLFHMLNNVIYKTCLFLCGGAVEYRTKTSELKNLGGLVSAMPITFMVTLIAAFSISGVPPFNGFVSKWMIYQGIVESNHPCWVVWITVAMFGSALTMASFTKLMYAMFFSESTAKRKGMKEVPVVMWLPGVFLAACCIIFGVAAFPLPLQSFIFKIMPVASFCGAWNPTLATAMLLTGLALGILFYLAGNLTTIRQVPPFLGGEKIDAKISGEEFYATIKQAGPLSGIYRAVENKTFDIYDQGSNLTFGINALLKWLHRGLLHTYLAWGLVGLIIIIYVLSK